jgi:hypothetical protein
LINMSELPRAAAQAAAVTACTRPIDVQADEVQSLPIIKLSSVVTVEAAG